VFDFRVTPALEALYKAQDEADYPVPCTNDPDGFFPELSAGATQLKAIRDACAACPIVAQCAEYGILNEPYFGMWGGLSVRERQAIRGWRGIKEEDAA
jgi:hypothetical protein